MISFQSAFARKFEIGSAVYEIQYPDYMYHGIEYTVFKISVC